MPGIYINGTVIDYLKQQDTKIASRILTALDYDIAQFVQYGDTIDIEPVTRYSYIPDYLYDYIKRHQHKIINSTRVRCNNCMIVYDESEYDENVTRCENCQTDKYLMQPFIPSKNDKHESEV